MTVDLAVEGRWARGPGGICLVEADHALLQACFEREIEVPVRRKDDTVIDVRLEHVTEPTNRLGRLMAYGWPVGTRAQQSTTSQHATVRPARRRVLDATPHHRGQGYSEKANMKARRKRRR